MSVKLFILLLVSLVFVPAAYATSFDFGLTDTQLNGTSAIAYDLALTGATCPPDCTMKVTITVSGTPNPNTTPVYLGSLVFKFGGSTLMDLDTVGGEGLPTAIPTGWGVVQDADVDNTATSNLHQGANPNGGQVGFYNTNLTTHLINLSTPSTFAFTFDAHGVNLSSNPSLHNEYYTLTGSTVNFDTFLSATASPIVPTPEPATGPIVLALSALVGVSVWMRKRRKQ